MTERRQIWTKYKGLIGSLEALLQFRYDISLRNETILRRLGKIKAHVFIPRNIMQGVGKMPASFFSY